MRAAVRSTLMLALVAVIAAGCGQGAGNGAGNGAGDSIGSQPGMDAGPPGVSCDNLGMPAGPAPSPTVTQTPLPAGFVPVAATRCLVSFETVPGDGEWMMKVEQRAEGDLGTLAAELRRPDVIDPPDTICTAIGYLPTIITLIDAIGTTTVPAIPHGACGAPMPSVLRAIADLPWRTEAETLVRRVRSELEVTSGCSRAYKPVIALIAAERIAATPVPGPVFREPPALLQICRYEPTTGDTVDVNGVSYGLGQLASTGTIEGAALTTFIAALTAAPAARPCGQAEAPFAELRSPDKPGPTIAVELGGCYRFTDPLGGLRQLDAASVAVLQG
jgi:hypothetical protein